MIFMMLNMVIMRCQQSPYFSWVFMTIIWKWELWKFENSDSWTRSTPMWHYMHGKWLREWFCLNVPSVFESNIEGDSEVKFYNHEPVSNLEMVFQAVYENHHTIWVCWQNSVIMGTLVRVQKRPNFFALAWYLMIFLACF